MITAKNTVQLSRIKDYYLKKYFLVNGIHTVLAIYAYSILLRKKIPIRKWKNYEINLFDEYPEIKNAMDIFSVVQIARIMHIFGWEQIQRFFPGITKKKLFNELLDYSVNVRNRFSNSPDLIERVFSLRDQVALVKKYEERIKKIKKFAVDNIEEIETLLTSVDTIDIVGKNVLIEIANLLDKTSKLFLLNK